MRVASAALDDGRMPDGAPGRGRRPTETGGATLTTEPSDEVTDRAATAFGDLFADEHPRLVAMVLAMTGDRGLAEDVAQEALARAYHRWDVVGTYERPGAWVRRVAINLTTSARRRRGSERRALARIAGRRAEAVPDATDADTDVWEVVRTLPRRQATALVLYYLADESVASVAEAMGCAEGTAKAHLHQGRAALARLLGDADPTTDGAAPATAVSAARPADPETGAPPAPPTGHRPPGADVPTSDLPPDPPTATPAAPEGTQ